jgi:hypothetical protein
MTSSCHLPSVLPQLPQFQLPSLAHVTFPFFYLVPDKLPYCLLKPALRDWVDVYSGALLALSHRPESDLGVSPTLGGKRGEK